jgi:class 3 adenylate cyclase/tetratricopeptide (TPR) repeat protein
VCRSENGADDRFCRACGAVLAAPDPGAEGVRRVVTVLFSDLADSTPLGDRLDPESLRHVMSRYFAEMDAVLRRHGGTVEKYIGDAIMAVFGVPRLHEDDALRAVLAATEMRQALAGLNEELERDWGVTIEARTGVETGEVVAHRGGGDQAFIVGGTVTTAARLQQSAQPGQILIGTVTYGLTRQAVVAEEVGPLPLKGKAELAPAWSVLDVVSGMAGWTRRLDSPLVGRGPELEALHEAFGRAAESRSCQLVTLIGSAGMGKSRLTSEFLSGARHGASVLSGRCLPYGEGITFWPVVAVLRDAGGISEWDSSEEAGRKIAALLPPGDESALVADRLAALVAISPSAPGIQETFWAVRKLVERLAASEPLVVVFDDIQWGEPTFLDLIEYLVDWIRDVPVLIVCLARPELAEVRAGWMAGKANARAVPLQPLTGPDVEGLIRNLVGGAELAVDARTRIAELAEGNPLFVEETLRMLVDDGVLLPQEEGWAVTGDLTGISIPLTIQALLTARLDRLEPEERTVIERASVIGRVFWWGAVSELAPAELAPTVSRTLQSLARKELIRPDHSEIREEDAFRFAHILVRDAAYRGIPKAVRAELHERLVDWIEAKAGAELGQYEEIVGYHLEQAHRSQLELAPATPRVDALGRRAAGRLGSAARRAFARGDMPAAVNLFSRATQLLPDDDAERHELLPQFALALLETGDFDRLQAVAAETSATATASHDPGLRAHALLLGLWVGLFTSPEGWADGAEKEATRAIAIFDELGDERGLAKGWSLLGLVHLTKTQFALAEDAWEKAAAHARRSGDRRDELESLSWVPICAWAGPAPAEAALARCQEVLERAQGDKKAMSSALFVQAELEAALGRFDEARVLIGRARALLEEIALTVWIAGPLAQFAGWVELWAGDPAAAERELRSGYETLGVIGEMAWLPTVGGILAEVVYVQGRYDEAERLAESSMESAGTDDVYSQALLRSVRAKVLARRGRDEEAEVMARGSSALADETDFLHLRWYALVSLAEVLSLAGRGDEAKSVVEQAALVAQEKGRPEAERWARELPKRLETAVPTR